MTVITMASYGNPPLDMWSDHYGWGDQRKMRALSDDEMRALWVDQMHGVANHRRTAADALAESQYRTPVHVPPGWRDWFAIGDQLH